MNKLAMLGAALAATVVAAPAAAQTYSPVTNGGPSAANFQYGYNTGTGFQQYTTFFGGGTCPRIAGTSCYLRGSDFLGAYFVTQDTATQGAFLYASDVTLHPGPGANELSVVRFIAPVQSTYNIAGFFRGVDAFGSGNGQIVTPNNGTNLVFNDGVNNAFNFNIALGVGDFIDFTVGNNGGYSNDTTGLNLAISGVPEPTSWALMIMGFGAIGGAMRAKRRTAKVACAA